MKLIVCDVEGTIFKSTYKIEGTDYASTMWQPLAQSLGHAAIEEEIETHKSWENKRFKTYSEWVEATIAIHKKYGLHRDNFYSLIEAAEYNSGVIEFFNSLDRKKYVPVLVSGGFEELIARAMRDLKIKHGYGACEYFFDHDDGKLSGYRLKNCDFDGKFEQIESVLKSYQLSAKSDWIFIGDGKNDVPIAKKAPLSFGINAHPELARVVNYRIQSFSEIHDYLLKTQEKIDIYLSKEEQLLIENQLITKEIKILKDQLKKQEIEPTMREDRLSQELFELRKKYKQLKQDYNSLKGVSDVKNQRIANHIDVSLDDYHIPSVMPLSEVLDKGYKVTLFGFDDNHSTYQYFTNYHKAFSMRSGFNEKYAANELKTYDFIFECIDCMSHDIDKKNKAVRPYIPYAKLEHHDNPTLLENAMANVLIRHFQLN